MAVCLYLVTLLSLLWQGGAQVTPFDSGFVESKMNGVQLLLFFQYNSRDKTLTTSVNTLEPSTLSNYHFTIHELPTDYTLPPNKRCTKDYLGNGLLNLTARRGLINTINTSITGLSMDDIMFRSVVLYVRHEPVLCGVIVSFELPSAGAFADFVNGIGGRVYLVHYRYLYTVTKLFITRSSNLTFSVPVQIILHNNIILPFSVRPEDCASTVSEEDILLVDDIIIEPSPLPQAQSMIIHHSSNVKINNFINKGISIRDKESGEILACARISSALQLGASYKDKPTLRQFIKYFHTFFSSPSESELLAYQILDQIGGKNISCTDRSAIFDPWRNATIEGVTTQDIDVIAVGDLPNNELIDVWTVMEVPLLGPASIIGHAVNDTDCNYIAPHFEKDLSYLSTSLATFEGPILYGFISIEQIIQYTSWTLGPTFIAVNISKNIVENMKLNWYISTTVLNESCNSSYSTYNPFNVSMTGNYTSDCTVESQLRCAMGDLTGKLGQLTVESGTGAKVKTYAFYDDLLYLTGPNSVLGRTLVIATTDGEPLSCAVIIPTLQAKNTVTLAFLRNGRKLNNIDRFELADTIAVVADVPLGHVLVSDIQYTEVKGNKCFEVTLNVTGINMDDAMMNFEKVNKLRTIQHGNLSSMECYNEPNPMVNDDLPFEMVILVAVSVFLVVTIVIIIALITTIIAWIRWKSKQKSIGEMLSDEMIMKTWLAMVPQEFESDDWELTHNDFKLNEKLGDGNFGCVYKGLLSFKVKSAKVKKHTMVAIAEGKCPYTIAVKVLKGNNGLSMRDVENFLSEIKLLKKVSSEGNAHVVRMVGCVTLSAPVSLLLEYVPFGNLRDWLRFWKENKNVGSRKTTKDNEVDYILPEISNKSEDVNLTNADSNIPNQVQINDLHYVSLGEVGKEDFLSFGFQIADGMSFLTSLGIIHRDLACRNVLVDEKRTLKISDFGLSREIPEYVSDLKDKLPLRWMAPETVMEGIFSETSDVWAYGITMWEIYTFGGIPYWDIPQNTIIPRLSSGYRLEKPSYCPDKVYDLIMKCWCEDPAERPSFSDVKQSFESNIIEGLAGMEYLQLNL